MPEFEPTPRTNKTYDEEIDEALEIARASGPLAPQEDEALQDAIRTSRAIVEDPETYATQRQQRQQQPAEVAKASTLKKVGVNVGIGATIVGGAYGLANLGLDAVDHQIEHNQEVNDKALQEQREFEQQLDSGVVTLDDSAEQTENK